MVDTLEKIAAIEEEIRRTPYHKGTEHHIGQLRARLTKLQKRVLVSAKRRGGLGFALKKSGDATVVLVGPPSVGKSTLLNKLTGAHARVEPWPFTTLTVIPGMMKHKGAQIQILDLPGVVEGAAEGKGRGKEVLAVVRTADLLLLMLDVKTRAKIAPVMGELEKLGIDLPMLVVINKVDLLTESPKVKDKSRIFISAQKEIGLRELRELAWQKLKLVRVYLKPKGKKPDFRVPLIVKKGQTAGEVVGRIFPAEKKTGSILLWGPNARFPGQPISSSRQLEDEDILSFL